MRLSINYFLNSLSVRTLLWLVLITPNFVFCNQAVAASRIVVDYSDSSIPVNKKVFGVNLLGANDPAFMKTAKKEYYSYPDFGGGVWDTKWNMPVADVIGLLRNAGFTVLRFPGGGGASEYDWKSGIKPNRVHNLFGLAEFLTVCKSLNAEAVFTLNYQENGEQNAVDLVKYCKSLGKNEKFPVVKYFEIGNEVYNKAFSHALPIGVNRNDFVANEARKYADNYILYYNAMKAVDPSIQIGPCLFDKRWNNTVLKIIAEKIDFGIMHIYPAVGMNIPWETTDANSVFSLVFAKTYYQIQKRLKDMLAQLKQTSGKSVGLAITEFNGGFIQEKPVPYRHSLGNALVNADLLHLFLKPENNVEIANHWNFVNEYWSMVSNKFNFENYITLHNPYLKRPNYLLYSLYKQHYGAFIVSSFVETGYHDVFSSHPIATLILSVNDQNSSAVDYKFPYLAVNASKSSDGKKLFIMVINKNLDNQMTATIELRNFLPAKEGDAWVLNGPDVASTNENNPNNVRITHSTFKIKGNPFEFSFEPHSITAIEVERLQ